MIKCIKKEVLVVEIFKDSIYFYNFDKVTKECRNRVEDIAIFNQAPMTYYGTFPKVNGKSQQIMGIILDLSCDYDIHIRERI